MYKSRFLLLCMLLLPIAATAQKGDIFARLAVQGPKGNTVTLSQPGKVEANMRSLSHADAGQPPHITGYRVRIYFDNKQEARDRSSHIISDFQALYPDIPVYRIYENPYFKVTVGDFRTRSEAMRFQQTIKRTYPQAFITKEQINLPGSYHPIPSLQD